MKKSLRLSSIYMGVLTASLLTSSVCLAGNYKAEPHNYKGERVEAPCPPPPCKVLKDGFYLGAQAGYDSYRVRQWIGTSVADAAGDVFSISANPVLNAVGAVGGGFLGYGMYFQDIYYLGAELWANGSAANTAYNVVGADTDITGAVTALTGYGTTVKANWSWGVAVLPGVKLNESTLGYARLGYSRHSLKTTETLGLLVPASVFPPAGFAETVSASNTNWYSGFQYGLGVETVFYPSWSVRGEYSHTNLGNKTNSTGTVFSLSDNQYLLSLIYHFDCTSIFA